MSRLKDRVLLMPCNVGDHPGSTQRPLGPYPAMGVKPGGSLLRRVNGYGDKNKGLGAKLGNET